jgi:trimeric autotransporter adhesin
MSRRPRQLLYASLIALLAAALLPTAAMAVAIAPPAISMSFASPTAAVGDDITLAFTITNPDPVFTETGIAFNDTYPAGLNTATPAGLTGTCGGGSIVTSYSSISLSGATLAAGASCTFSVHLNGGPGTFVNTTGSITSNESQPGNTATASVTVGYRPMVGVSFSPNQILPGGTSTLTISLLNPEFASDLVGVGFTDTLPAGLTVANATTDACDLDSENLGTLTTSGGDTIVLTGGYLPASWICTLTFTVTSDGTGGTFTNSTGPVTSANGIPGLAATADLYVGVPATDPPATLPPTSTAPGGSGGSDPSGAILFLLAMVAGLVAVGALGIRNSARGRI